MEEKFYPKYCCYTFLEQTPAASIFSCFCLCLGVSDWEGEYLFFILELPLLIGCFFNSCNTEF